MTSCVQGVCITHLLDPSTTCIFLRGNESEEESWRILLCSGPSGNGENLSKRGAMNGWYTVTNSCMEREIERGRVLKGVQKAQGGLTKVTAARKSQVYTKKALPPV